MLIVFCIKCPCLTTLQSMLGKMMSQQCGEKDFQKSWELCITPKLKQVMPYGKLKSSSIKLFLWNIVKFRDLSSIQSVFQFWYRSFSPYSHCSLTCQSFYTVSFYQDSSSLENHLRGTTGQGRLVRGTRIISCLKVIWQSKWTVAKGCLCSSGKI